VLRSRMWRVMPGVVRLALLLPADFRDGLEVDATAVLEVAASTSAVAVEASTVTAARYVGRNTSTDSCELLAMEKLKRKDSLPFEETPAPISISGSSKTMPPSSARPPVPPCSAVNAHLRSASVSLEIGITLMPVV